MTQIHEHSRGRGPHPGAPAFPHVPAPRRWDVPPAGLSYGYGPPSPYGPGWAPAPPPFSPPPTLGMPMPAPAPPSGSRGRTVVMAIVLSLVVLGGIVAAVGIMGQALAATAPPAPGSGPAAPPAPGVVPSSHYTLTSMFTNNGTCTPTTADQQPPLTTEGLSCAGRGNAMAFVFYRYTGTAESFQDSMVQGWGGTGLTQRAQDDCRTQYTGTVDVPGVGPTPVVVDIYRHSPFAAVTAAASGAGTDALATPQYRVADRAGLCAGG